MIETESEEIARRLFVQSEENYRQAINMYPRDEYSYQGLAELHFKWSQKCISDTEQADYLAKAEEIITTGLSNVHNREGLWIISAEIQKWLGNTPSHINALEKAVQVSPNSIFPRYILGRAYRKMQQPLKALEVLRPVIQQHFEEYRCFVEYSVALIHANHTYREAISILEQSKTFGLRDPRFIATLGGMYFMNSDFDAAEKVFQEANRHNFTSQEKNTIQFQPPNTNDLSKPLRLKGQVVNVLSSYCFVESRDYARFFCPGTKYNGIMMKQGLEITFEPAFTAKGSVANDPATLEE